MESLILLEIEIKVYTDHKNLTYAGTHFNSDHRLRHRLLIEEYDTELIFVADGMSRLDFETIHETMKQCYLLTETEHSTPPFDLQLIAKDQEKCVQLKLLKIKGNVQLKEVTEGLSMWRFKPRQGTTYLIYVPKKLQIPLIEW